VGSNLGICLITINYNYLILYKSIPLFQTIKNPGTLNLLDGIFTIVLMAIRSIYRYGDDTWFSAKQYREDGRLGTHRTPCQESLTGNVFAVAGYPPSQNTMGMPVGIHCIFGLKDFYFLGIGGQGPQSVCCDNMGVLHPHNTFPGKYELGFQGNDHVFLEMKRLPFG